MVWVCVGILSLLIFGVFVYFSKNNSYKLDAPLLGLFTLAVFLITIALVQPESMKFQGLELVRKVQSLEKNLRPYVL
jgi:hypothetical protein